MGKGKVACRLVHLSEGGLKGGEEGGGIREAKKSRERAYTFTAVQSQCLGGIGGRNPTIKPREKKIQPGHYIHRCTVDAGTREKGKFRTNLPLPKSERVVIFVLAAIPLECSLECELSTASPPNSFSPSALQDSTTF